MNKICIACKKQFATGNEDQRLCWVCEKIAPAPVDLTPVRAARKKQDLYRAFVAHVRDRMTEIIANPGNAEYVNMRAALVRQDAEDLLDE